MITLLLKYWVPMKYKEDNRTINTKPLNKNPDFMRIVISKNLKKTLLKLHISKIVKNYNAIP